MKRPIENQLLLNKPKDKPKGGDPSNVRKGLAWLKADGFSNAIGETPTQELTRLQGELDKASSDLATANTWINDHTKLLNEWTLQKPSQERSDKMTAYQNIINEWSVKRDAAIAKIASIKDQIESAKKKNAADATLSPSQRQQLDIQAQQAQVQAASTLAKAQSSSKTWMFVGITIGMVILIGGIAFTARLFNKK